MRVYIETDLEGVAGVRNFEDWASPGGRYYDLARELLTLEINAAIEGLPPFGNFMFLEIFLRGFLLPSSHAS